MSISCDWLISVFCWVIESRFLAEKGSVLISMELKAPLKPYKFEFRIILNSFIVLWINLLLFVTQYIHEFCQLLFINKFFFIIELEMVPRTLSNVSKIKKVFTKWYLNNVMRWKLLTENDVLRDVKFFYCTKFRFELWIFKNDRTFVRPINREPLKFEI